MTTIGERLKTERLRLAYTQIQLAKEVGVAQGTQTLYETGKRTPDARYLSAIHALGLDVTYIVAGVASSAHLDPEDQEIIRLYRKLDLRGRHTIQATMRAYLDDAGA